MEISEISLIKKGLPGIAGQPFYIAKLTLVT